MNIRKNKQYPGSFIVIEGVDGAGKSTVVNLLMERVKAAVPDREVVHVRTPDGPIRKVLLDREFHLSDEVELLLYAACHGEVLASQTIPALQRGAIVICDRFTYSMTAYQGFGRKLLPLVDNLINNYLKPPEIDHLIFVQAESQVCLERLRARGNMDFMDKQAHDFRERCRNGMLTLMEFEEKSSQIPISRINNNTTLERLNDMCQHWVNYHFLGIDDRR